VDIDRNKEKTMNNNKKETGTRMDTLLKKSNKVKKDDKTIFGAGDLSVYEVLLNKYLRKKV